MEHRRKNVFGATPFYGLPRPSTTDTLSEIFMFFVISQSFIILNLCDFATIKISNYGVRRVWFALLGS